MALTFVQSKSANSGATTNSQPSLTLTGTPAQGNLLVVIVGVNENSADSTISGLSGWTQVPTDGDVNVTGFVREFMFYKIAGAGESTTVSASLSGSNRRWCIAVAEFNDSGGGTWILDKSAQNSSSAGSSTADTGTTATTAAAAEVWFGGIANVNATLSTPTNSFNLPENTSTGTGSPADISMGLLYKIVAATGTANTGLTLSTGRRWVGAIATFYSVSTAVRPQRALTGAGV